ncbi:flavin reductase family protein [Arthrobacter sp. GCM10027362]|uniref:flavin reductase family protein n=1 Tax=Arthrobacter sp. GCM10027362 TaxID=3273379 RepID=UPI003639E2F3
MPGTFTSVSPDPPPVAFPTARNSFIFDKLRTARSLAANILAHDQEALCRRPHARRRRRAPRPGAALRDRAAGRRAGRRGALRPGGDAFVAWIGRAFGATDEDKAMYRRRPTGARERGWSLPPPPPPPMPGPARIGGGRGGGLRPGYSPAGPPAELSQRGLPGTSTSTAWTRTRSTTSPRSPRPSSRPGAVRSRSCACATAGPRHRRAGAGPGERTRSFADQAARLLATQAFARPKYGRSRHCAGDLPLAHRGLRPWPERTGGFPWPGQLFRRLFVRKRLCASGETRGPHDPCRRWGWTRWRPARPQNRDEGFECVLFSFSRNSRHADAPAGRGGGNVPGRQGLQKGTPPAGNGRAGYVLLTEATRRLMPKPSDEPEAAYPQ